MATNVGTGSDALPQELFEPLSHASVPGTEDALDALWPTFAEEAVRMFLESHRTRLDVYAPTMAAWLRDEIEALTFEQSWHPSVGLMARPAWATKRPVSLAVAFALHASATEPGGDWSAQLEPYAMTRIGELVAWPERISVKVTSSASEGLAWDSGTDLIVSNPATRPDPIPGVRRGGVQLSEPAPLLVTDASSHDDALFVDDADPFTLTELEAFAVEVLAGLEFVARYAPEYVSWIHWATSVIVPCRAPDDVMLSGSSNTLPGLIRITASRPPATTAEMLIHEASHQYLHVALRASDVDDGSDDRLYYSPVKKAPRPLDKILTAYHAFANVEIFYSVARKGGWRPSDTELEAVEAVSAELDVLETPLRENAALTTAGRGLFEPLLAARPR